MILGVLMALMTLAALAFVILPLLGGGAGDEQDNRGGDNLAVYRERLDEIESEAATGTLSPDQAESARNELAQRALAETPAVAAGSRQPTGRRQRVVSVTVLAVLMPALAIIVAWQVGGWQTPSPEQSGGQNRQLPAAILSLKNHLGRQPDDIKGWNTLGQAYMQGGLYDDAAQAFARANSLSGNRSPELLVAQGSALGQANARNFRGKPARLFDRALKLDPDFPQALWFGGVADYQAGDFAGAAARWEKLRQQTSLPPRLATALKARIADAQAQRQPPSLGGGGGSR